jgi:hypothetical protein
MRPDNWSSETPSQTASPDREPLRPSSRAFRGAALTAKIEPLNGVADNAPHQAELWRIFQVTDANCDKLIQRNVACRWDEARPV